MKPTGLKKMSRFHWVFLGTLLIPCWIIGFKYFVDLKTIYKVAELAGTNPLAVYHDFDGDAGRFFYGPIFIWLVRPMAFVPQKFGTVVWLIPQTVSYFVFWICLLKLIPGLFDSQKKGWWLLLFAFAINPIHNNFQSNNIQLILCAMLMLGHVLMGRNTKLSQGLGASLVSLAAVIKIFPAFMWLYYFVTKPKQVKLFLVMSSLIVISFPLMIVGWNGTLEMYRGLISNVTTYQKDNSLVGVVDILCLPSMIARIATAVGIPDQTYSVVAKGIIVAISTCFFGLAYLRRNEREEYLVSLWALGLALMAFLNPSTRVHYFIFYLPAFCAVVSDGTNGTAYSRRILTAGILSFVLVALTMEGVVGKSFNNTLEGLSVPTLGAAILLLGLVQLLKKLGSHVPSTTPMPSNWQ
ncbi:MAG: DUF2029 domain-containing protein [Deltaproteobacteria bacterium]|nr:DUF2029 domain-containing protein [Deltaproteobacteria bacterium]